MSLSQVSTRASIEHMNEESEVAYSVEDMAVVANVVEEMVGRELTLSEWHSLEQELERGTNEEEAVKKLIATCANTPTAELMECETHSAEDLEETLDDLGRCLDAAQFQLQGHALIVGPTVEHTTNLETELLNLGLTVDGAVDPSNLVRPIPEISGLTSKANYIFISESCCLDAKEDFCQQILARGAPGQTALLLIDEDLELCDTWGEWPLAGVLSLPLSPTCLQKVLDEII